MSVLAVIQARYSSSRLHGKALADLHGKPVIQHVIERANRIVGVDRVVLALPKADIEAPLIEWALEEADCDVHVWPGPVNDVLGRFVSVLQCVPEADTVVRITGDCPLLEPFACGKLLELYRANRWAEYAWLDTHSGLWPDGLDCEVFSRAALLRAAKCPTDEDREHVTVGIRRQAKGGLTLPPDPAYAEWPKLSIDDLCDLERVREWMASHE